MKQVYSPYANVDAFAPQPPWPRTDKAMDTLEPFWGGNHIGNSWTWGVTINATDQVAVQFKLNTAQTLTKISFWTDSVVAAGQATLNVYADDGSGAPTGASLGTLTAGLATNYGITNLSGLGVTLNAGSYVAVVAIGTGTSFVARGGGSHYVFDGFGASVKTGGVWVPMGATHHGWSLEFVSGLRYGLPFITSSDQFNNVGLSTAKVYSGGVMIGMSGLADCAQLIHGATLQLGFAGVKPVAGVILRGYVGTDGSALPCLVESVPYTKTPEIAGTLTNVLVTAGSSPGFVTLKFTTPMIVARGQRWSVLLACTAGDAANYYRVWRNLGMSSTGNIGKQSQLENAFGHAPAYVANTATIPDPGAAAWTEGCPWMQIYRMLR